jgi:hypothetical protein
VDFTIHIPMWLLYGTLGFFGLILMLWVLASIPVHREVQWRAKVVKVFYQRRGIDKPAYPFHCELAYGFCTAHMEFLSGCDSCLGISSSYRITDSGNVYPEGTIVEVIQRYNLYGNPIGRKVRPLPNQPKREYLPQEFKTRA